MRYVKATDRDAVETFFTGNATHYSKLFLSRRSGSNFSFRERLTLAAQMTGDLSGGLLDCACGTGEITASLLGSGRFTSATIVDLSSRMLGLAEQCIRNESKGLGTLGLRFLSSDIFEFAMQPRVQEYNLILCLGLIAHTGRLDELLGRLKTLLLPGGSILLQSSLLDHGGTKLVRALTRQRYYRQHGYRISYFRHQDILQAAQNAGLEVAAVRRFTFGFPFGDRICAGLNYCLERTTQNWANSHGAEAMYLLRKNSH